MSDEKKLDVVLNCIKIIYHLDDFYISIIRDNITLRVNYYNSIIPDFSDETIYIKNSNTITDFFLNRLINNIRNYGYDNIFNPNNKDMKEYDEKKQLFKLPAEVLLKDYAKSKLNNRINDVDKDLVNITVKKMISHEFSHALNINYSGYIGYDDNKHNQLVNMLSNNDPNTFIDPSNDKELEIIHNGIIPIEKDDEYQRMREYYAKKEDIGILDDIFNEYEALKIHDIKIQGKYFINKKCYKYIYNYETTNYKISSFADEMGLILGKNKVFNILYKDEIKLYEFFDSFEKLSTQVLKNNVESKKPVVSCILSSIVNVKNNNSIVDNLKLDLFFSKCLKKRIKFIINSNKDIKIEYVEKIKELYHDFRRCVIKSDTEEFDHDEVFYRIHVMIKNL